MVDRGGRARTYHVPQINRFHIVSKIEDNISIEADLIATDESQMYKRMPENVKNHEIVNHSAKEWVRGDVHTCTIDGYWGLLKRGIIGSFHLISIKAPPPLPDRVSVPLESPPRARDIHAPGCRPRDGDRAPVQATDRDPRARARQRARGDAG